MSNKPNLDEINARIRQAQYMSTTPGYSDALNKALQETYRYGSLNDQNRLDVANTIVGGGGMTSLNTGDIASFDWDNQKQTELDRVNSTNFFRNLGLFDTKDYATNKGYTHMSSLGYLNSLLPTLQAEIEASQQTDRDMDVLKQQTAETSARWYDLMNADNETEMDRWYNMLMADYLLGDRNELFDFETIDSRYGEMSDEEYNREYQRLTDQWNNLDWETLTGGGTNNYQSKTAGLQEQYNTVSGEVARRTEIDALKAGIRGAADYGTLSAYNGPTMDEDAWINHHVDQGDIDTFNSLYSFVNNNPSWEQKTNAREKLANVARYIDAGYDYLTPDELADYNYLINSGRTEDAARYLELLGPELLYRRAMVMKEYQSVKATNPWLAAPTWVEAGIQQIGNVFNLPVQIYETWTGKDNPYSAAWDAYNKSQWTSEAQVGAINDAEIPDWADKALTFLYKGTSGARDNFTRLLASGFNPTGALILAGAQSTSGSLHESSQRNDMNAAAKIIKAIGTGIIEVGTEKIGLDALFDRGQKGALEYLLGSMGAEIGEETLNAMSEPVLEAVVAFLFDHEAEIMSGEDFWKNLTDTAITTALSSLFMSGGSAIQMGSANQRQGKALQQNGDIESVLKFAEELGSNIYDSKGKYTQAESAAQEIREMQKSGKNVGPRHLGRLINAITADMRTQDAQALNSVLEDSIEERLVELGEDTSNAKKLAPVIRNVYQGKKLTLADRASLHWTDAASQVVKEMATFDSTEAQTQNAPGSTQAPEGERVGQRWKTATKGRIAEVAMDAMGRQYRLQQAMTTKKDTAVEQSAQKVEERQKGKPKLRNKEISYIDSQGAKHNATFEKVVKRNGRFFVVMRGENDLEVEAIADAIDNAEAGLATIIEHAAHGAKHDMSAEEVNVLAAVYQQRGGNIKAVIRQFEDSYLAGYSGLQQPQGADALDAIAYEQGAKEAEKDEEQRIEKTMRTHRNDKPRVTWLGDVSSDAEVHGQGDEDALEAEYDTLTEGQQMVAEFSRHLAEQTGLNVVLFRSKARDNGDYTTQNGSYDSATHTIYLDVNAGNLTANDAAKARKEGTLGYAIMRTMGHEVTHAIEATSPTFYAQYREAVKQELMKAGKDWTGLVRAKLDNAVQNGEKLTYGGAVAEVVADASEYMLQDSAFVNNLDTSLRGKVKAVIKDFAAKIKAAFRNLSGGSAEARALRNDLGRYNERLQKLWDAAFVEMQNAGEAYEYPTPIVTDGDSIVDATEVEWQTGDAPMPTYRQFSEEEENAGAFVSYADEAAQGTVQKSAREQTMPVEDLPRTRQFELRRNVEQREDGLMAVHNLSADKLTDTLELGGFPMPSIAIVKAKHGHTMYGGYSVIFSKDAIDPEKNAENRVYGNDAWTPTFPQIETELDSEKLLDVRKKMSDSVKKLDGYMAQRVQHYFNQLADQEVTTMRIPDLRDNAWDNHGMLAAYLTEQGQTVNIMTHEVDVDRGYNVENAEMYDAILDVMGDDAYVSMRGIDIIEKYGQALADANDKLAVLYRRYQAGDRRTGIAMLNRVTQAKAYNAAGRDKTVQTKTENDYDATRLGMQAQIDRTAYNTWVENVLAQFMGKKGIYNGKERFTNSGNRRSFKYLHDAYTAENVIRAMQKEPESDISPTNAKGLQAAAARRYDSIEAIRADSSRLGKVSEEEYNAALAEIDNELHDFLNSIEAWDYDKQEQAGNLLVKAAKSTMDNSGIVRLFKSNGFMKITPAKARHAQEIIRQAQNMPTGYFEAKPARVVGFDEIKMIIAPDEMPKALAAKLDELGIPYTTYDGTDEDRLAKANAVENVQFSRRDAPTEVTTREFLTDADSSIAETIEERNALTIYQKLLKKHATVSEAVIAAEEAMDKASEEDKPVARKMLAAARAEQKNLYNRLLDVERTAHVQAVVKRSRQIVGTLYGKKRSEVDKMVSDLEKKAERLRADLQGLKGAARVQQEADLRAAERNLAAYKSKAAQALLANSEKYQQQIAAIRLRRDINAEIGKRTRHIARIVKALNDRIVHEEDYKNVKEPLKPVVHKLVQTFIDGFGNMVFSQQTASRLRTVYDELAKDDGAPEFYSDDVADWLSELADMRDLDAIIRAEGSSSLSAAEEKLVAYTRVAEIADHIYKLVTDADKIFLNGRRQSFAAISGEVGNGLAALKDKPLLVGKARDGIRVLDDLLRTGNMTPTYFFQHLNNSGLTKLFDNMMDGQTKYAQAIREGQEAVEDAKRRYNFYSWQNMKQGVEFRTEQGHDIALTVPQMMWVYATAKREATNRLMDTHHLDQGGFRYEAKDLPRQKGKMTAIPGSDRLHKLSAGDVRKITDTLTAEQKACADELVGYLSNECAEQGNEASMEMFGIKKYNEEYYFPFKTASDQRYQRSDAGSASTTNDARVKHASFTHSLRRGANTPLVMGNFFDVIADHINLMATYSSFVVPIESMNRVLNAKVNEETDGSGNDVTIRSLMARKYGEPAQKYVADLMKDLNGGPQTDNRGSINALFRAFKRGAVMGSLSVALQQPTAIARAFAYVNPKYFAHITMEGNKKTWERMMKYSGTAVIKDMGRFDVGTGKMANDWIANSDLQDFNVWQRGKFLLHTEGWNAVKNHWIDWATALPGVMDRITWTHIWKAIEAEQAERNPSMDRNSDEFLTAVGKRFDDVINRTQVYDSILAKSQNMRSKNAFAQMSTAFMAEPTLNINMLYDAVRGNHTAGERAGIITSVMTSSILAAAMASLIAAWNKDDDERKLSEKYLAEFASRAIDSVNPLTMIPYVSDVWGMMNGYDIERTDLSVVKDMIDYTGKFFSNVKDPEKANTWRDYENFFGTIANMTGIPAKNWSRDVRRIRNLFNTDKSASSPAGIKYTLLENIVPLGLYADSNKAYCQRLVAAAIDGDTQETYDLWDYLTNSKKASQSSINTNIRDELKRRVREGTMAPSQATEILRKYAPYVNDKDNINKPKEWVE